MRRPCCWLLFLCLFYAPVWAEAPDPISFEFAIERGNLRAVTRWLDEGLSPEYEAAHIGSGLMVAAWHGNIDMMALFVARGADVRRINRFGEQALQLAAWGGHFAAVTWLLEHGAPLERGGQQWGPLHYAAFNGHETIVRDLLARGANVNARAPNGSTPLMMAAREGHENVSRLLLEAGANSRLQSDWGDTALTMAMRYNHLRVGQMISSPEEFAIAVKVAPESSPPVNRSAVLPRDIEEIMKEIRAAEAEGRPSDELHKQLQAAVKALRTTSTTTTVQQRPMPRPYQPRTMLITARRGQPGAERAQLQVDSKAPAQQAAEALTTGSSAPTVGTANAKARRQAAGRAADLLRQIRLAEAQGLPTDPLRQELYQLVDKMKP